MEHKGWIGGRNYDIFFFFFPSVWAVALGCCTLAYPVLVAPMWWLWVWLIEGPHLVATFTRTYFDSKERKERQKLLLSSLLLFVPGIIIWGISRYTSSSQPFELLLGFAVMWAFYHGIRQHYGVMCIYHKVTESNNHWRQKDAFYLYVMLWAFVLLPLVLHKANHTLLGLPQPLPVWLKTSTNVVLVLLGFLSLWYLTQIYARWQQKVSIKPAIFVLFPVVGLTALLVFVFGMHEPIYPNPINSEQLFLVIAILTGISHGMEYLGIVFVVNKKRYQKSQEKSFWAFIGQKPMISYLVFVLISLIYLALNAARGGPQMSLFGENTQNAQLFLAIYWGLFFHHYYLDQKIWKISKDKKLQKELQIKPV